MGCPYVTKYPTMITKMINQIISKFDPLDGSYCFQLFRTDEIGASSIDLVYLLFKIADGEITAYNLSYSKSFNEATAAFLVCDSDGNYGANAEFWVSFISFE